MQRAPVFLQCRRGCSRGRPELAALGYRERHQPVDLTPTPIGALDRETAAERVLTRLAAGRTAWNPADVRGEAEQLLAADGIVTEPAVRIELAEDLTARALARCVPLLERDGAPIDAPEHVRAWTSRPVLDVEAELTARLAARATIDATGAGVPHTDRTAAQRNPPPPEGGRTRPVTLPASGRRPDAGQAAAAAVLASRRALVVLEGAAGAGKTTSLSAARALLNQEGRRLMVVNPTLKAAKVAAAELAAAAGSAAWLVFQHGWRWTGDGGWTRLSEGDIDPVTGPRDTGPSQAAQLRPADLLVVDEAGMLDQDTARALLTVADECRARVALLG